MSADAGFTLIEMVVVLAIIGILVAVAAPPLRDAILNARMVGMVNDTMADLNVARSEAVKRNTSVTLCPSVDGSTCSGTNWALGWIIFQDDNQDDVRTAPAEELIKATPAITNTNPNALTVVRAGGAIGAIRYGPSGGVAVAQPTVFTFCDIRAGMTNGDGVNNARQVTINTTGRPVHTKFTCAAP